MDVSEMQKKLSLWATENPAELYRELYHLLCTEPWLRVAANKVLRNEGSNTAGVDGRTKSNFLGNFDGYIKELQESLIAKTFEPMPVRRVYIPKPNSEKKRPLGIPTLFDRIVQEALRMVLEPIWEADFSTHSYGFRPNRSTYDAIAYIGNRITGQGGVFQWVIEGDIASYFDTIPHRRLIKAIKKRVADRDIRDLLWKFLRAGVMYRGKFQETLTGTPQGGIASPLLANIYLHELDKYMESTYLQLSKAQHSLRRRQKMGNCLYVRYADDFVILCNGTKERATQVKEEIGGILKTMGLTLSEDKTKITHITEGFTFLGYEIIRCMGSQGKMVPKVRIPEKAIKRFQHNVRRIIAPNTHNDSVSAKIRALNNLIRGWCQYYRCTSGPSVPFDRVGYEVYEGMAHWLGRKFEISKKQAIIRYGRRVDNTFSTQSITLLRPSTGTFPGKKLLIRKWHNPYTAKEAIVREKFFWYERLWSGYEGHRTGWGDRREEAILLKGTVCALNLPDSCESKGKPLHPYEVEMDHIMPRWKFKDPREADSMDNLQPTCTPCHRAKTKIDLKVESRMRR